MQIFVLRCLPPSNSPPRFRLFGDIYLIVLPAASNFSTIPIPFLCSYINLPSRFRLFGDTVNMAARMETHSLPGRIHVSQEVADQVRASGVSSYIIRPPRVS